jgi:formylglycine-generating enzyme required for sulfatase activity
MVPYSNWAAGLREPVDKATAKFIEQGLITVADLETHLDFHHSKDEIQDLLKKKNLPVSGNKRDLINRLVQSGSSGLAAFNESETLYILSPKGKRCSEEFWEKYDSDYLFKRAMIFILGAATTGIIGNRADDAFVNLIRGLLTGKRETQKSEAGVTKGVADRENVIRVNIPQLKTFEFDTVRLDSYGKIMERRREKAKYFVEDLGRRVSLEMIEIPGGAFTLGSPDSEAGRSGDEGPQHKVNISPFFMGKFTITQKQWRIVAGWSKIARDLSPAPSRFKGDLRPVQHIEWQDAKEFCARLAKKTGKPYRLPTEAEWEYACRAGTTTPFAFGETITYETVNYNSDYPYAKAKKQKSRGETTPVGNLGVANAFGLFDMHGNIWEWCEDIWHGNYDGAPSDGSAWLSGGDSSRRMLRGGSYYNYGRYCRSACRYNLDARYINYLVGFRVVVSARTGSP